MAHRLTRLERAILTREMPCAAACCRYYASLKQAWQRQSLKQWQKAIDPDPGAALSSLVQGDQSR